MKSKGLTVGTVEGYLWAADLKECLGSKLKTYASGVNRYQDLQAGRLDVCADSHGSAVYTTEGKDLKVEKAKPFDEVRNGGRPGRGRKAAPDRPTRTFGREPGTTAGHTKAGHTKAGHTKAGHTKAGHTKAGHTKAGHTKAGHPTAGKGTSSPAVVNTPMTT